jgi:DNA-binding transcriptional ArsR family regulator
VTVFEVLAEPRRRQILDLLRQRELAVGDLVERLQLAQPAVSKHLRVLRDAGLVTTRIDGPRRIYALDTAPLRDVETWLSPYRELWSDALDRLERHLETPDPPRSRRRRGGRRDR